MIIPTYEKSGKEGRRIAWVSEDLLVKLSVRRECTGSGSRNIDPGKYIGMLLICVGIHSGKLGHR